MTTDNPTEVLVHVLDLCASITEESSKVSGLDLLIFHAKVVAGPWTGRKCHIVVAVANGAPELKQLVEHPPTADDGQPARVLAFVDPNEIMEKVAGEVLAGLVSKSTPSAGGCAAKLTSSPSEANGSPFWGPVSVGA